MSSNIEYSDYLKLADNPVLFLTVSIRSLPRISDLYVNIIKSKGIKVRKKYFKRLLFFLFMHSLCEVSGLKVVTKKALNRYKNDKIIRYNTRFLMMYGFIAFFPDLKGYKITKEGYDMIDSFRKIIDEEFESHLKSVIRVKIKNPTYDEKI